MKTALKVFASLVTLLAACCLHAADSKPIARVMSLMDIETDDPSGYATWIAKYNEVAKAKLGIDSYLRVFQSRFDSRSHGHVRVVTSAASAAELAKNVAALQGDPAIRDLTDHLRGIRKTGSRVLYQAVHFEGASVKNAHNYSMEAVVTDEAAYLKALAQLRTVFDSIGLKDAKISAYRVLAGRTDHSHRVTISTGSAERLAAFLDAMGTNPQLADWLAGAARLRTVVATFTAQEITK